MERKQPVWLRIILNLCGPVGLGVTLMGWVKPGLGIAVMAVGICYVIWEIYPWAAEQRGKRPIVTLLVFVIIGAGVGALSWWIWKGAKPEKPSVAAAPTTPSTGPILAPPVTVPAEHHQPPKYEHSAAEKEEPPTLLDLYQKEMPQMMKGHREGDAATIPWSDGTFTHIKAQVYLDFDAKTKFVGFYIPATNPMESAQSAQACLLLNQNEVAKKVLDKLSEGVMVTGGRADQMTNAKDLIFSGRVLIYHEAFLSITEKADIIRAFAAKQQDVQFRGPDYLGDAVTSWYRDHGIPKPKQQ